MTSACSGVAWAHAPRRGLTAPPRIPLTATILGAVQDFKTYPLGESMHRNSFLVGVAALGVLLLTGCAPTYPKCDSDENCKEHNEVCVQGQCRECATDAELQGRLRLHQECLRAQAGVHRRRLVRGRPQV